MKNKTYLYVFISMCGLSASAVGLCYNSVSIFYQPVSESLNILRGTFALHVTIATIVSAITALFATRFINENNFKKTLFVSVLLASASTCLMSSCNYFWQFLILGILRGLGTGFFSLVVETSILKNWFYKKYGLVTSIVMSFGGVIGASVPPILSSIISINGWRIAYICLGILIFLFALPNIILPYTIHPETKNMQAYGYEEVIENNTKTIKTNNNFNKTIYVLLLVYTIMAATTTSLGQHLPSFASDIGISATISALFVTFSMIANIVSKIMFGSISDKLGTVKTNSIMLLINLTSLIIFILCRNEYLLLTSSFLFGFLYSVTAVGLTTLVRTFFGLENYDRVYPTVSLACSTGASISISLIGYIFDFFGSYIPAFTIAIVIQIFNLILLQIMSKKALN